MLKHITNPLVALQAFLGSGGRPVVRPPAKVAVVVPDVVRGVAPGSSVAQGDPGPYLAARREWNERYGEYIQQARHWRAMALCSALVAAIALLGLQYISGQRKVIPYVVQVNKLGEAAARVHADQVATVDPRVIKAYLARFVADWRSVTVDRQAQKSAIDRVYSMLPNGSVAVGKVNDYFHEHNPFVGAATRSVDVEVTNLLPISDQTWQVEWQELFRDSRGQLQGKARMQVSIIVGITPPTEEKLIVVNPLGVYITDLNWSRQL